VNEEPDDVDVEMKPKGDSIATTEAEPKLGPFGYAKRFAVELRTNMGDIRYQDPGVHASLIVAGVLLFAGGVAVGAGTAVTATWLLRRGG
jgi:hypothetical protein